MCGFVPLDLLLARIADSFCSSRDQKKEIASPDGKFITRIVSKTAEFTEDTVAIVSRESASPVEFSMTSASEWNGRYVLKSGWSADSKFFVFSTSSSGAHSSWHFQTFLYSVDANRFASVDDKVRPVTNEDFKLIAPHTLQVDTLNPLGIDYSSMKRTIDLVILFVELTSGT
jgi:hypothetical protein